MGYSLRQCVVQWNGKYDFGTESVQNKSLLCDAEDKNGNMSIIQKTWEDIEKETGSEDNPYCLFIKFKNDLKCQFRPCKKSWYKYHKTLNSGLLSLMNRTQRHVFHCCRSATT